MQAGVILPLLLPVGPGIEWGTGLAMVQRSWVVIVRVKLSRRLHHIMSSVRIDPCTADTSILRGTILGRAQG